MKSTRLIEIDALRGLAVLAMVFFHVAVIGAILRLWNFDGFSGVWVVLARFVQFIFLGLVGVSIGLSSRGLRAQLRRAGTVFVAALLVSVGSFLVFPHDYVRFGVLHCIALSIPVVTLFKKHPRLALLAAVPVFFIGEWFLRVRVESPWFLWLGLHRPDFSSLDYFPILPWLAVPLVGLFVGSVVYAERRSTRLAVLGKIPGLVFLGRHALAVYLLHPPVVYFSLLAFSHWISS